jgi:phage terminase large subunit-like protein
MKPDVWAERAVAAYREFSADRIVAEVNNGGDLVERNLRTVDANVSYRSVVASRGKITRAEPIASLYGLGKVSHTQDFPELVSQMIGYDGKGSSPDRLDALVWGLSDLMLYGSGSTEKQWIA